ncbi:MAG: MerR family transcriptional regulator [Chloroflexi bacterium]|nr:MerR family transcriptional regulator [Chloroflexota bacterium]MCC6892030.1 MerR family transcriptional regulator [Anaerolineae bacterium]
MIKIGDFARLGQVSVVTLRHYDEIGLIKPVKVDRTSGYRYYEVYQLARLNRILALKDLGFSLEQIEQMLNADLTIDQLREMLKTKHAEVERQLVAEQERLRRIATRLRQIELEDTMPNYEVTLKTVAPMLIASNRVTIPTNDQVPQYLDKAYHAVYSHIQANGIKDTGVCFALWHQPAAILANEVAEAAVPVEKLFPGSENVQVYELPQTQVASVMHEGSYDSFTNTHAVLLSWIEANGYAVVGPYREIYLKNQEQNPNDATAEVQYPVEKLA